MASSLVRLNSYSPTLPASYLTRPCCISTNRHFWTCGRGWGEKEAEEDEGKEGEEEREERVVGRGRGDEEAQEGKGKRGRAVKG